MSTSAAPARISVLLYSGPGASGLALRLTRQSLSSLLHPSSYAISLISHTEIVNEPWPSSTALLVFPGGADEFYARELNGQGNAKIRRYVENGGRYLGLCAGGYYGSKRCEWRASRPELPEKETWEVAGPRELAFFPGTCRGSVKAGFEYGSERGTRAVKVKPGNDAFPDLSNISPFRCYVNGGGVFVDADTEELRAKGVQPLSFYDEEIDVDGGKAGAASVCCTVGKGVAILSGFHPEFDPAGLDPTLFPGYEKTVAELKEDDKQRVAFLRASLQKFGLKLNESPQEPVPRLSKMYLCGFTQSSNLLEQLGRITMVGTDGGRYIRDEADTFRLEQADDTLKVESLADTLAQLDGTGSRSEPESSKPSRTPSPAGSSVPSSIAQSYSDVIKRIIVHADHPPTTAVTPRFDLTLYIDALAQYTKTQRSSFSESAILGVPVLYGEVVTSTNTLLEKNPALLRQLPTGFTLAATRQLAARGRGSNAWVSPEGALMFSVVVRHEAAMMTKAPVVFLQYLAGMAVVAGAQAYYSNATKAYATLPVRLKWPNDIYARDPLAPAGTERFVKVGGVLVNSHYDSGAGEYVCVVGIGVNVLNAAPTTSLAAVLAAAAPEVQSDAAFRLERLQASIVAAFGARLAHFRRAGWDAALEREYEAQWLHGGQVVTLESEGGVRARIRGVSRDWGMLEAEELPTDAGWFGEGADGWTRRDGRASAMGPARRGRLIRLQSDGNSFDFFRGLVKRKV